jgi:hypothetical protein
VSILVRVTKAILLAKKARKPAVPLRDYQVEVAVLESAIIAARSRHKSDDTDCTICVIGRKPEPDQ